MPDDIQHTKERKPDALKKITDSVGKTFVLHLKFQLADEPEMILRMAEYYIMLRRQYKLPVRQCVFFLGTASPNMPTQLHDENMHYHFPLISFSNIPYEVFTRSQKPEEIILGVLANFQAESKSSVLRKIIPGLDLYSSTDFNYKKYYNQLRILAQMRNLVSEIDTIMDSILPFLDEKKDIFYVAGKAEIIERCAIQLFRETDFSDEKIANIIGTTLEVIQSVKTKHGLN